MSTDVGAWSNEGMCMRPSTGIFVLTAMMCVCFHVSSMASFPQNYLLNITSKDDRLVQITVPRSLGDNTSAETLLITSTATDKITTPVQDFKPEKPTHLINVNLLPKFKHNLTLNNGPLLKMNIKKTFLDNDKNSRNNLMHPITGGGKQVIS